MLCNQLQRFYSTACFRMIVTSAAFNRLALELKFLSSRIHKLSAHSYQISEAYWRSAPTTVSGMLGAFGVADVTNADLGASRNFLSKLLADNPKIRSETALDCGCGIGRVTKSVLLRYVEKVDLVDVTQKFLDASVDFLGPELNARISQRVCCGLQDFTPKLAAYDVIWCQWALCYLTDTDFIAFLKRCSEALTQNGIILVKDHVSSNNEHDFDDDGACTRSRDLLLDLFLRSDLRVIKEEMQTDFPKGFYEVRTFALQPNQ